MKEELNRHGTESPVHFLLLSDQDVGNSMSTCTMPCYPPAGKPPSAYSL